jgi:hypothetical protein
MRSVLRPAALLLALALAAVAAPPAAQAQAMPLPQKWWARIVLTDAVKPGLTGDRFELTVSRLSDDEEVAGLIEILRTGNQLAARDAMRRFEPKGFLRVGKLAAAEVTVIRVVDLPDGTRRLRLFCDFPIRLYDKSEPILSPQHPFGFLELVVGPKGEDGTGTLIAAASLTVGDDGLRVETAAAPILNVIEVTAEPAPPARR